MAEPYRKKLIEVALPLEAINRESAREKSIRHGHPSTLHLWWARRPLAACRAVLLASIVDDPSSRPDLFPTEEEQERERQRLFRLIEELVKWENTTNEAVLEQAREEIRKATDGNPPPVLDPFCGGGSIPLEAQRLGLEAHASDLNPVAVLITKALIEIPPKFAGRSPVNPESRQKLGHDGAWKGAQGLAEDVRYYGKWMRDEAFKRIGHLYPNAKLPDGTEATVVAWIWARTVTCPNPACGARMPLVRSFALSTKKGKETWAQPRVLGKSLRFEIRKGSGAPPEGTVGRRGARCVVCEMPVPLDHVRAEGKAGRMRAQMMAIVAEGERGRIYLPPDPQHEDIAMSVDPPWGPDELVTTPSHDVDRLPMYGMLRWRDAFAQRQLMAMTVFNDLISEARKRVVSDASDAAYADAVAMYLAFAVDRSADFWCTIATWSPQPKNELVGHAFGRQAIPMTWDYGEVNPFSSSGGNFDGNLAYVAKAIPSLTGRPGAVTQLDARHIASSHQRPIVFTDPPYYDNVGYADLSDFFYVWLRRSMDSIYPDLFSTLLAPKTQELIAAPYRFNGERKKADAFFEDGLRTTFSKIRDIQHRDYPLAIFYAFKQSEVRTDIRAPVSTGWETMLTGLLEAGLAVTGTWPVRSERSQGLKSGTNALASSIVLVCRARAADAALTTRREFLVALRAELPAALRHQQHGSIAPVDLAQAAIGPGMAVFSRYPKVLEADGSAMTVRTALGLINQALDEVLTEQESEYDADTRWAVAWFDQHGMDEGAFGDAETLSKAKNSSVQGMVEAGVVEARAGKVRLLLRSELDMIWDPSDDTRLTVWETTQHLIWALEQGGEASAAELLRRIGALGEIARDLAYRLYTTCERKGWAQEALAYNALVVAWPEIVRQASATVGAQPQTAFEA